MATGEGALLHRGDDWQRVIEPDVLKVVMGVLPVEHERQF